MMKRIIIFSFLGLLIVLQSLYAMPVADRYIVVFQDWVGRPDLNAQRLATQHGLGLGHIYRHALKGCVATVPFNKLDLVKNDPDVKYVSQDQGVTLVGNDRVSGPGKPGGGKGGTTQPAQVLPFGIHRVNTQFSSLALIDGQDQRVDVDVAVLDTGIDKSHPDLNVVGGVNFSTGRATNFKDGNGHGTHVSGTIGALDNAIGVVGVGTTICPIILQVNSCCPTPPFVPHAAIAVTSQRYVLFSTTSNTYDEVPFVNSSSFLMLFESTSVILILYLSASATSFHVQLALIVEQFSPSQ